VSAKGNNDRLIFDRQNRGFRFFRTSRQISLETAFAPLDYRLRIDPIELGKRPQALLTMLSLDGGTAEQFRKLVEARDRLLAAIGTSAPPPKPPAYAPKGVRMIYRRISISGQGSLGSGGVARLGRAS
jgi:hypothetical protein